MNEAEIRIAQTILPRDWTSLRDVVLKVVAFFGRDLDLVMINRYLHEGLLELALVAPDSTTTVFSRTDCEHRTIHAPFNRAEGVRVEPYEAGRYLARLAELTSPATATPPTDQQASDASPALEVEAAPAPAAPAESPTVLPARGGELSPTQNAFEAQSETLPPATQPNERTVAEPLADSAKPAAAPHPGGRPPVVNWSMVGEEVFRLMDDNSEFTVDDPEWNAQARLEEAIADFCQNKFKKHPGETTIKDNIREPLERWRQSRSET